MCIIYLTCVKHIYHVLYPVYSQKYIVFLINKIKRVHLSIFYVKYYVLSNHETLEVYVVMLSFILLLIVQYITNIRKENMLHV